MKNVSWIVPYVIVITGVIAIVSLVALLSLSRTLFDAPPGGGVYSSVVWVKGTASSRQEAEPRREEARRQALAFLHARGFGDRDINVLKPMADFSDAVHHNYEADQQIEVKAVDYAKLARLNNAVASELDPGGRSVSAVFPVPTFTTFAISIAFSYVVLLAMAIAALETRGTDVNTAPRGMHPIFIGAQTILIGLLIALALVYAHLLAAPARIPFLFASGLGVALLVVWLWKTAPWWRQSRFLRGARAYYIAALVLVVAVDGFVLAAHMT